MSFTGFLCCRIWGFFVWWFVLGFFPFLRWFLLPKHVEVIKGDDRFNGSAELYKLVLFCAAVRSWTGRGQYKA